MWRNWLRPFLPIGSEEPESSGNEADSVPVDTIFDINQRIEAMSSRGREVDSQIAAAEKSAALRKEERQRKAWLMEAIGIESAPRCLLCSLETDIDSVTFLEDCTHYFCRQCLLSHIRSSKNSQLCCPATACSALINQHEVKALLSNKQYDEYLEASLARVFECNDTCFIACPKEDCKYTVECIENDGRHSVGDSPMTAAESNRQSNRFRCPQCTSTFCKICACVPYHDGYTCEDYKAFVHSAKCRFCGDVLPDDYLQSAFEEGSSSGTKVEPIPCCSSRACQDKLETACEIRLECGHLCLGVNGFPCPPCLHSTCQSTSGKQSWRSLCSICYLDELGVAPCVTLACGHVFHHHCLLQQLENGWPGARITFNFLNCAICKHELSAPSLETLLTPLLELRDEVQRKALERLRIEGMSEDRVLTDKSSRFFSKPVDYAMHALCFYPCYHCKRPYFGGKKDCAIVNIDAREFDAKELVCGSCSSRGADVCPDHGADYIEYKCKFCCNPAVWFCWGTTHFCQDCHENAATVLTKRKEELPACTCSFVHPPNGEEFSLGCAYCRMLLLDT